MSDEDLRELEKDVEEARARLTGDLTALGSPDRYSAFAENLKQAALETKDSLVEDVRARTRSVVDDAVETLKAKAVANPTAVLVIGAGLAWHLLRRPPITAALVGGGLYSLLKTSARRTNGSGNHMADARENLKAQAMELMRVAGEVGRQAAALAGDKAADLADRTRDRLTEAADAAGAKAAELTDQARDMVSEGAASAGEVLAAAGDRGRGAAQAARDKAAELSRRARKALPGSSDGSEPGDGADLDDAEWHERYAAPYAQPYGRPWAGNGAAVDKLLLGAAGLAVAATVGVILQRRLREGETARQD